MADAASPLSSSWASYRILADNSIDVIMEADPTTRFTWVSPSVRQVLGWRPEDLIGLRAPDVVHPDDLAALQAHAEQMNQVADADEAAEAVRYDKVRIRLPDGGYRSLSFRASPVIAVDGTVEGHIVTLKDTSDRDEALRALSVLTEANRVIAVSSTKAELLEKMCRAIMTAGEYPLVWFGKPRDDASRSVAVVTKSGPAEDYVHDGATSWAETPEGQGPTGRCLRGAATVTVADMLTDPNFAPWRSMALEHDLRSSIALPVMMAGELTGALMVYSREPRAFEGNAQALFETLASDLGLGLERLRGERLLAEQTARLRESETRYRLLAENASDLVWQTNGDGEIVWVSDSCRTVLGYEPEDVLGPGVALVHPDDVGRVGEARGGLAQGRPVEGEVRLRAADGRWRWMAFAGHPVDDGEAVMHVITLRDIDAEVRARVELDFVLGHDPLTGMVTRPTMVDRIAQSIAQLDRGRTSAVLCVGVDRLSHVNEAFTHATGDIVLTTIAKRIAVTVGNVDQVGRGTGVEFLVLISNLATGDEAVNLAEQLRTAAHEPISHRDGTLEVTVSVGIAIGQRGSDAEQLIRDASAAMSQAKVDGRDRYGFADPTMADQARRRLDGEHRIREGLKDDRFDAYFQPIVDLATSQLTGYEALVRFRRDDGSLASPGRFMAIAEASALVADIDLAVLYAGLRALRALPDPLTVSVNVSMVTLTRAGYPERLHRLIAQSGIRPARLHLEVTETALLGEVASVVDAVGSIAALGARWYVDDFGTGYSSISHLRDLPISGLKLDVSFSRGIREGDEKSTRLANALVGLARGLSLDTVAEGIETEHEAQVLLSQGWRHGQGYLYGQAEPLP